MAKLISKHLGILHTVLDRKGVFDSAIGIDSRLFLDPYLLKSTRIPEFKNSREKVLKHFRSIVILLKASKAVGDKAWKAALKRMVFPELKGVSIGYGTNTGDGSAIGRELGSKLVRSAQEIIDMGIQDPEVFELIGLFEEGFGADRLSDMAIWIIKEDIYSFTQRIAAELKLKKVVKLENEGQEYILPEGIVPNRPILFLPKKFLRDLPVAYDREQIGHVVAVNEELRQRLNVLINEVFTKKIKKQDLRKMIFSDKQNIRYLLDAYKQSEGNCYDFDSDPLGEARWYELAQEFASRFPLFLGKKEPKTNLKDLVGKIVNHFKKHIEVNGLNEHLYKENGDPKPERASQLLFYATADTYCESNNLDLSREPNAGSGPVDFKVSNGYFKRVLVELKLSSSSKVLQGFVEQLPAYEASESSFASFYVVIKVTKTAEAVRKLERLYRQRIAKGQKTPEVIVIDGLIKPSASKRPIRMRH